LNSSALLSGNCDRAAVAAAVPSVAAFLKHHRSAVFSCEADQRMVVPP
jgi:hypothetical protein